MTNPLVRAILIAATGLHAVSFASPTSSALYASLEIDEVAQPAGTTKSVGGITCVRSNEGTAACTIALDSLDAKAIFNALSPDLSRPEHNQNSWVEEYKSVGGLTCTRSSGDVYRCSVDFGGK